MNTSEDINEIAKAMSVAQGEMQPADKDSKNPFFKSKYTSFTAVWDAVRDPLKTNSLTVWQDVKTIDVGISVTTRIVHSSGQWVEFGPLEIPIGKKDAQSIGSAISYGKRYSLSAALGVVSDEDDDGEKAVGRVEKRPEPTITPEQAQELQNIFVNCSKEFITNFWNFNKSLGITSLDKIPLSRFEAYRDKALANRKE